MSLLVMFVDSTSRRDRSPRLTGAPGARLWSTPTRAGHRSRLAALATTVAATLSAMSLFAGCAQFAVRRAALVPHIQPTARTGQPMGDTRVAANVGSATALSATPAEVEEANSGVEIPRWHVNGAMRFRLIDDLDLGLLYDRGLQSGARKLDETQPDLDNGDVSGYGVGFHYSIPTAQPGFRVGLATDLLVYSIPYVEYRTCVENCAGQPVLSVENQRDSIAVGSFSVIPSWKPNERWTVFASLTGRNHPTVDKKGREGVEILADEEIEGGPLNVVANAGAECALGNGFRAAVHVYQPVYGDPVAYKPTVGVNITLPLWRERRVDPSPGPLVPRTGPPGY